MIVDLKRMIAYKCWACGELILASFGAFDVERNEPFEVSCSCGETAIKIYREGRKYVLDVPCVVCVDDHAVHIPTKELWNEKVIYLACPEEGLPILVIGDEDSIKMWVKEYDAATEFFLNDSETKYFLDDEAMLSAVDKIHDIAEQENLYCRCGSFDIELELLYDKIVLSCSKCGTKKTISIVCKQDVENIHKKNKIVLIPKKRKSDSKVININFGKE